MTPEQLQRDQQWLWRDFPTEPLTIGAITIGCLVPDDAEANDWIAGGKEDQPRATVIVPRTAAFVPRQGDEASYRGQQWRIAGVRRDHENSPLRIELEKVT